MLISQMSSEMLLFTYSTLLKQIDQLYAQKKDIEKEIASRNESLKQKYQDGKMAVELEDEK